MNLKGVICLIKFVRVLYAEMLQYCIDLSDFIKLRPLP